MHTITPRSPRVAHDNIAELEAADRRRAARAIRRRWWYSAGAWFCARRLRRSARAIERGAS